MKIEIIWQSDYFKSKQKKNTDLSRNCFWMNWSAIQFLCDSFVKAVKNCEACRACKVCRIIICEACEITAAAMTASDSLLNKM